MADKLISKIPDGPLSENGQSANRKFILSAQTTKENLRLL